MLLFFTVLVNGQNNSAKKIFNDFPINKSFKKWQKYLSNTDKFIKCQSIDKTHFKYKAFNNNSYGKYIDSVIIYISRKNTKIQIEQIIYFSNSNYVSAKFQEIKNTLDKSYRNMGNYHFTGTSYTITRFGYWYKVNLLFNYPQIWVDLCLDKDVGLSIHSIYKKKRII